MAPPFQGHITDLSLLPPLLRNIRQGSTQLEAESLRLVIREWKSSLSQLLGNK